MKINDLTIILFMIFYRNALFQADATFSYDAKKIKISMLGKEYTKEYRIDERYAPNELVIYYLDLENPQNMTSDEITRFVKKATFKRSEGPAEIYKQIPKKEDPNPETEVVKENDKKKPDDDADSPIEPAISGKLTIRFQFLNEHQIKKLNFELISAHHNTISLIIEDQSVFNALKLVRLDSRGGLLSHYYSVELLNKERMSEIWSAIGKPVTLIDGDTSEPIYHTNWIKASINAAFLIIIKSIRDFGDAKILITADMMTLFIYKYNPYLKITHLVDRNNKIKIQVEKSGSAVAIFETKRPENLKLLAIVLRHDDGTGQAIYNAQIEKGSFRMDGLTDKKLIKLLRSYDRYELFMHVIKGVMLFEISKRPTIGTTLTMRVVHEGDKTRIGLVQRGSGNYRSKLLLKFDDNKTVNLFYLDDIKKRPVQLEFKKQMLIDTSVYMSHHFGQFINSKNFISQNQILPLSQFKSDQELETDYAYVKNGAIVLQDIDKLQIYRHESKDVVNIFLYQRSKGLMTSIQGQLLKFENFEQFSKGTVGNLEISIPPLTHVGNIALDFKAYDMLFGMKEFPMNVFEVIANELFFIEMPSSFQAQLKDPKVEICDPKPGRLGICLFSCQNWKEIDLTPTGVTIWDKYSPHELPFDKPQDKIDLQVVYINHNNQCQVIEKEKITFSKGENRTKYLVRTQEADINKHATIIDCVPDAKSCTLMLFYPNAVVPNSEELSKFEITVSAKSCKLPSRGHMKINVQANQLTFEGSNSGQNIRFFSNLPIDVTDVEHVNLFDNEYEKVTHGTFEDDKGARKNRMYFYTKDKNNFIFNNILQIPRHSLALPLIVGRNQYEDLELSSFYKEGLISLILRNGSFDLSTEEFKICSNRIWKTRVYDGSRRHSKLIIKLFIKGLEPIVAPLEFKNPISFKDLIMNSIPFKFGFVTQGNIHKRYLVYLKTFMNEQAYEAYYILNKKGELELLLYDSKSFDIIEGVKGYLRFLGDDLEKTIGLEPKKGDMNVICKLGKTKPTSDQNIIGNVGYGTSFYLIDTSYPETSIFIVAKNDLAPPATNKSFYMECMFSKLSNKPDVFGFYEIENLKYRNRLI